jgi:hypothetical protein
MAQRPPLLQRSMFLPQAADRTAALAAACSDERTGQVLLVAAIPTMTAASTLNTGPG